MKFFINGQKRWFFLTAIVIGCIGLQIDLQAQITASGSLTGSYSDLGTAINACTTGSCTLTVSNNTATIGVASTVKNGVTVVVKSSANNTKRTITRNNNSGSITVSGKTLAVAWWTW